MDPKKKRLLVLTSTFPRWQNDSKPSFVFELSKRLSKSFDVFVLAPHFPGAKTDEILDGIKIKRFRYFLEKYEKITGDDGILAAINHKKSYFLQVPFFILAEFIALMRSVKKIKPDLIHAHWVIPQGFVSYLNYLILKTPYTITSHGSDVLGIRGFTKFKRITLKCSKNITAVSKEIKDKIYDIDSSLSVEVIPMGVDTTLFCPEQNDPKLLEKYDIKGPFLLFVGRISPEKGLMYLIEAMPIVVKEYQNAKLLIIGAGNQKNELERLTQKLKLKEHIVFVGKLQNLELPRYYATADVFVCPSLREGNPVSYIEALACATPIIVGDLPVSREIIKNTNGLLIKQRDPDDIARKIIRLLKSRRKSIQAFQVYIKNNFDWDIIAERYGTILNK